MKRRCPVALWEEENNCRHCVIHVLSSRPLQLIKNRRVLFLFEHSQVTLVQLLIKLNGL